MAPTNKMSLSVSLSQKTHLQQHVQLCTKCNVNWPHVPVRQRVAFKNAGLVHQSLAGAAPAYLADNCHLLSNAGRRTLRSHSNDIRKLLVPRTHAQQTWRQEFLGSRSSTVERSFTQTAAAGTFLRFFQTIFENTSLWRLKRLVTLSTYRRYINIYLSIYLPTSTKCHRVTQCMLLLTCVMYPCFYFYQANCSMLNWKIIISHNLITFQTTASGEHRPMPRQIRLESEVRNGTDPNSELVETFVCPMIHLR